MKSEKKPLEPLFNCSYCDKKFNYDSERKRHELSHTPQFKCKVCCKDFSFVSALKRHEKQHNRSIKVKCDKCNKQFRDEILLKRHVKYAHEGSYTCAKCSTSFSSEVALSTHMKSHKPVSERTYKCRHPDCSKAFNSSQHLKHHELTHTNTKPYFCNICAKGFIQFHHLKSHLLSHEPENWLPCLFDKCTKKFSIEYARKRHLRTHKNEDLWTNRQVEKKHMEKETIFCATCGKMIARQKYPQHCIVCEDLDQNDIHSNKSLDTQNQESKVLDDKPLQDSYANIEDFTLNKDSNNITDYSCQSVIGKCIVTGENERNQNCLCAQIKLAENESYDFDEPQAELDKSSSQSEDKDVQPIMDNNNSCDDCECALDLSSVKTKAVKNKITCCKAMPKIEFVHGSIIKLKDLFDDTITINVKTNNRSEKANIRKSEVITFNSFNSCKAALGNCLASDDGSISEGCLCAKMFNDSNSLDSQEIDEITPNPTVFEVI